MVLIQGDSLEKLKELQDNSVDSIVTDPPYELGFMGKSWDNTGIANNVELWKECLRVLKPGGHLLAFSGTRTYHRMASAIEDAGFEVRDMIEWVYSTGFPKSLNIAKQLDKKEGVEHPKNTPISNNDSMSGANYTRNKMDVQSDLAKQWEGWGTALKPAHEPICMARKPLGQQELDIAKNICYNITEKGLITNSKIIWRINNVKTAEKQKTKQSSIPTQQQKMVVVSAEFVETKENESVGKKIQKLIDSICESGIQETGNKPEKQVRKAISKTKTEYQDTGEHINTNEKQKPLKHTEESASVVENQDLSSSPLTTLEVAEDSTEKKSKTETSMSSLKSTDTQKTDIDCSAQTATSQWVCMDIVRTLKVSFEGKEYDFAELSDGSLVWNEALEPYRKQQKLNVAENCLKYGTGGINIDESRVGTDVIEINGGGKKWRKNGKEIEYVEPINEERTGRFPANLIHDNSEEVRECFPETKSVVRISEDKDEQQNTWSLGRTGTTPRGHNDSGNASRFFKSIIYQAKSSKSERNKGLDSIVLVDILRVWNENNTTKEEKLIRLMVTGISPQKVIAESGVQLKNANEWNTCLFGKHLMEKYQEDIKSITKTETNSITTSQTLSWLIHLLTNEYTVGVNLETENGGNPAVNVENSNSLIITINETMALVLGVKDVVSGTQLKISVKEGSNIHSTVKPIALMEYLIKMVTPKGGIVLDPFMGSGSTGVAAKKNGYDFIGIEMEEEYIKIAQARIENN